MASTRSPVSYVSSPASIEPPSQRYNQVPHTSNIPRQRTENRAQRCRLYIRQQPRAARAGPDGKDRRTIDPPPILQLQIPGFNPGSPTDLEDLRSAHWVVHCRLVSSSSPRQEMGMLAHTSEDGQSSVQRLLLGNYVSGPTFCGDDPDPDSAPEPLRSAPSSPSARLMMARPRNGQPQMSLPATFFIFADLSVRKAGEYRLEFKLMKMEPQLLFQGSTVPTLHSVTSDIFKVVNAKDFDQVQPSTKLVRGLLDRGAGFPLKLKKGPREGQTKRSRSGYEGGADDDDDDDAEDE
jgi:Velvet factor